MNQRRQAPGIKRHRKRPNYSPENDKPLLPEQVLRAFGHLEGDRLGLLRERACAVEDSLYTLGFGPDFCQVGVEPHLLFVVDELVAFTADAGGIVGVTLVTPPGLSGLAGAEFVSKGSVVAAGGAGDMAAGGEADLYVLSAFEMASVWWRRAAGVGCSLTTQICLRYYKGA